MISLDTALIRGRMRRRFVLGTTAAALAVSLAPLPVFGRQSAEEFINVLANQVLDIVKNDERLPEKREAFRTMLVANADIPAIAVFSLGKYARRLSERDRVDYYSLVAAYISHIFVTHAVNLGGEQVNITGSVRRSEREMLVSSRVRLIDGNSLPVTWRVIEADGGFKVFDVSVNGIWLAIQQRSEFVSVVKRAGGNVQALLEFLRGRS